MQGPSLRASWIKPESGRFGQTGLSHTGLRENDDEGIRQELNDSAWEPQTWLKLMTTPALDDTSNGELPVPLNLSRIFYMSC